MIRVAWLAEGQSWGPLTRAISILGEGTDIEGVVLAQRSTLENQPLIAEGVPYVHVGCCGRDRMQYHLEATDADVIVADFCWWPEAISDGRPHILMGMHSTGTWDLDGKPIHPWAWKKLPTRAEVRASWGVPDDQPVVVTMSVATRRRLLENALEPHIPKGAFHVSLGGWEAAHTFVGADLVVATAGWSSSWEARWSGVPYALVNIGGPDQPPRATHTYAQAQGEVSRVRLAGLPGDHRARPQDWVEEFVATLHSLAKGYVSA